MQSTSPIVARRKRRERPAPKLILNPEVLTRHEDGVAWLTVLGERGSWGYGRATPDGVVMMTFKPGLHWVDQTTVDFARRSGISTLLITDEPPRIARHVIEGPLAPEHFDTPEGIVIAPDEGAPVVAPAEPEPSVPLDFDCMWCPQRFPSEAARDRHVEFEHERQVQVAVQVAAAVEALTPKPEPALTDA